VASSVRSNSAKDEAASNRNKAIRLLNGALGIARAGVLRAEHQYCVAYRNHSPAVAGAALERANAAWLHAKRIAERIADLGGEAELPPAPAANDPLSAGPNGHSLAATLAADLQAQRATIKTYRKIAYYCQTLDPHSQRLIEKIVEAEEESAAALAALMDDPPVAVA
jgi:bacterioferritin